MSGSGDVDDREQAIVIDKVRASKAGHAYHEAWAARSALELLLPSTDLWAITLEGFDVRDEADLAIGAVEIADLVRYRGQNDVARASRVEVVQFKYSIASADKPVRAADLAQTLTKFGLTDAELRAQHGDGRVARVVRYEYATNRPIHLNLAAAIAATIQGVQGTEDIARQQEQIAEALKNYSHPISELLSRLSLSGALGSLRDAESGVAAILAAWSEPSDPDAEKRLLKLRNLIRIKAGHGSEHDKRIDRVAVLAELEVEHEDRLYPTPDAFPAVKRVVKRAVLDEIVVEARASGFPLILHATGGVGKTVLMQGLAERLRADGPIVLFDGFGAGRWRDPADSRHRPERTLVHLANILAGRGLCDILLPVVDVTTLLRAFRRRLMQSVSAARQTRTDAVVTLILDAIDHAGLAAQEAGTKSFSHEVLRSLSVDPVDGVRVIASSRTERLALAVGGSAYREFPIPPFTRDEAIELISARDPSATPEEMVALVARSGCNPRCLDNLLQVGRPYDPIVRPGSEQETSKDLLDNLLRKRLEDARESARSRGARDAEIDLLLTGLALLAPPVPIDELAAAQGTSVGEVESFAADLAPLLERTPFGIMFRDEPIETLIRATYGHNAEERDRIVAVLSDRQSISNYAARALPALLTSIRYVDQLIALAFEESVPRAASQVSARDIRLARITAALNLCASLGRRDDLIRLLLEASLVAAGHERSDRFLYEHPDLAAVAGDAEALRRLAATRVGWPGGKHAALALASVFAGDMGEARRNARRSIDWHNWAATTPHRSAFDPGKASRQWDVVGFAYVEMLVLNDIRVTQFLANLPEAYSKFSNLFDLLERHRLSPHPPADRLWSRLRRCRIKSSALWAAALHFSDRDAQRDRVLLSRLAAASGSNASSEPLASGRITAAARAIDLDMPKAANAILAGAPLAPLKLYNFSSPWPVDRTIDITVLAAGVSAALRRKTVTLIDIAPTDILALVPPSVRGRGSAAFHKVLKQKLAERTSEGRKRRRKGLDDRTRSDYSRAVEHRIEPLISYAQAVAEIVRPPRGRTRSQMLAAALDKLAHDVEQASDYPYPDAKTYLADTGFRAIFAVADAVGAIDATIAERMAEWLTNAPGMVIPQLARVVTRLSRTPACHYSALKLASHVEKRILLDTDVASRVSAYGMLARAIWRVGVEEAAVYFRRALDLAEAIGSDDFDRANHLLELTSHCAGPELSPESGQNLARILELNQSEDDKFPWSEYASAMVPVAGLATLAMLTRLDDRDKARLGLSLGPTLTMLVRTNKLPAELATTAFGLAAVIETWTWDLSHFAVVVLERLLPERKEWFFGTILVEIDRRYLSSPPQTTIEALRALTAAHLPTHSPARARLDALAARCGPTESAVSRPDPPETPVFDEVNLDDPDDIDRAIQREENGRSGHRWPQITLARLARRATSPAQRLAFVRATIDVNTASLSEKIYALEDYLTTWSSLSPALRDALPDLALRLASKHARELVASDSEAWGCWRGLINTFNADRPALVEEIIASLSGVADDTTGDSWLALAAKLATAASADALAQGLERFLARSGQMLPVEVGDGPYDGRFAVEANPISAVAGLIWARLGDPEAAMRWRAAHAIRRLADIGRFDVIDLIVGRFDTDGGLPFSDAKLPFFTLHARLSLVMALARVTLDRPDAILRYRALLERVAFSMDFPHVAMRSHAIDALQRLAVLLDTNERGAMRERLEMANRSPFPYEARQSYGDFLYQQRPATAPEPEDAFGVDYDFRKYQVSGLCRVFGCAGWEVEDGITRWVRRWDKTARGMNELHRDHINHNSWSSGRVPERDRYGDYLGWHGLMLAAGDMLATRIVTGEDWSGDAWAAFLAEYRVSRADGLWLADATDLSPPDLPRDDTITMPDPGGRSVEREDHSLLSPMLGITGGRLNGEWMTAAGRWSLGRHTTVTMSSVLANPTDARATAMTILSNEPFSRWLPHDAEDIEGHLGRDGHSIRTWIEPAGHNERQFDIYDPLAAPTAMSRPVPADWVCAQLALTSKDPIMRDWSSAIGPAFRAEAWGTQGGRGENAWDVSGYRLFVERNTLLHLLDSKDLHLVGVLLLQRYHDGKRRDATSRTSAFSHRSFVFVLDPRGRVWAPYRISRAARAAIQRLDSVDFYSRFRAIVTQYRT